MLENVDWKFGGRIEGGYFDGYVGVGCFGSLDALVDGVGDSLVEKGAVMMDLGGDQMGGETRENGRLRVLV